jgi:hypothetical protein
MTPLLIILLSLIIATVTIITIAAIQAYGQTNANNTSDIVTTFQTYEMNAFRMSLQYWVS